MPNYTLTYSEGSKGFPSFYSYNPEYMIGMNNFFYSFKNGQLYRHNTNDTRNSYYGTTYASTIKTVINSSPLDNKLFKTLNLESTDAWSVELLTDVAAQSSSIESTSFVKKEGNYFAYVRTNGATSGGALTESDFKSRANGGVGEVNSHSDAVDDSPLASLIGTLPFTNLIPSVCSWLRRYLPKSALRATLPGTPGFLW